MKPSIKRPRYVAPSTAHENYGGPILKISGHEGIKLFSLQDLLPERLYIKVIMKPVYAQRSITISLENRPTDTCELYEDSFLEAIDFINAKDISYFLHGARRTLEDTSEFSLPEEKIARFTFQTIHENQCMDDIKILPHSGEWSETPKNCRQTFFQAMDQFDSVAIQPLKNPDEEFIYPRTLADAIEGKWLLTPLVFDEEQTTYRSVSYQVVGPRTFIICFIP